MDIYQTRPDILLRGEGLVALVLACTAYQHFFAGHWGWFALLFLVPDVSLLGFLRPPNKLSTGFYNVVHCYALPLLLGLAAWNRSSGPAGQFALIWVAHIGFDRFLGFGLKFPQSFRITHIQNAASIEKTAIQ
jgi:hypothetical protein